MNSVYRTDSSIYRSWGVGAGVAFAASLTALLAGCGGGNSSNDATSTPSAVSPTAASPTAAGPTAQIESTSTRAYTLTVNNKSASGTVSNSTSSISCVSSAAGVQSGVCSASFTRNSAVTLTATPSAGYTFASWRGCRTNPGTTCNVTLSSAVTVSATFTKTAVTTPPVTTPPVTTPPVTGTGTSALTAKIAGNRFVDGNGNAINFRGVNVSGLEFVPMGGWSSANPWGNQTGTATPNWTTIKSWGVNMVRIPLNESSWLGTSCVDAGGYRGTVGATINPDPGGNYRSTVAAAVSSATAAGLYVVLDLHWTAPGSQCAATQNPMADTDHSLSFWSQVATAYKSYGNVMFEAFNEPFLSSLTSGENATTVLQQGGTITQYLTGGSPYSVTSNWTSAGHQQIVNAIRATGATNPILVSGQNYTTDLSTWLASRPTDPLNQIAATWHAYPSYGTTYGTAAYKLPNYGQTAYNSTLAIMNASIPVLITEFGDQNSAGTASAPFASSLLPWADTNHVSYIAWAWDVWTETNNVLIKDAAGTPTDGFGVYVKQHYLCRAAGTGTCS